MEVKRKPEPPYAANQPHPGDPYQVWRWSDVHIGLNIQTKIIMPYLILTIIIAAAGMYIAIGLVKGSHEERLNNHLLESARAVQDGLARYEKARVDAGQQVRALEGVAEALSIGDAPTLEALLLPLLQTQQIDNLILVDRQGQVQVHLIQERSGVKAAPVNFNGADMWIVADLLKQDDPGAFPIRTLEINPLDGRYYYYTSMPVNLDGQMVGVTVLGARLENLIGELKSASLAEVTVYINEKTTATTLSIFSDAADQQKLLQELDLEAATYHTVLQADNATLYRNLSLRGRGYRATYSPLRVGHAKLGVFSVMLSTDFITVASQDTQRNYIITFAAAMCAMFIVGYLVARRITIPIQRLVDTSRAVTKGDLTQRTHIVSRDEVGVLAATFDEMTARLEARTDDLTRSLQTQKELAGRMRSILSSIGDGVLLEDPSGNFMALNAAAEQILTDMSEQFKYGPMREFSLVGKERADEAEHNPWLVESRRIYVADKVYTIHSAVVSTDEHQQLGTVIVFRDVTMEVQAEQLKDAFVAHVSHELRTPLTSIKGYTSLMLSSSSAALNAQQKQFMERIARHTDDLVAMINALLDFSEVEARGRLGLRWESVALGKLVAQVADEWREKFEDKDQTLNVNLPMQEPIMNLDPARLRWAIINLVRNAHQYTPESGEITLNLTYREDRVILDVIDNGVGIPPEEQRRLFSRFYRVMNAQDDLVRGLGLGLYVSNAIVEAHGGYIQVVSEVQKGSVFTIVLPLRSREITEPPATKAIKRGEHGDSSGL